MSAEKRPGYFQDKTGEWHKDRRVVPDRRLLEGKKKDGDHHKRNAGRRMVELGDADRDHRQMIREALDDFAAEHGQQ